MKLGYTRSIVDAIHSGALVDAPSVDDALFGFAVVNRCPNVPDDILVPRQTWARPEDYDKTAKKLATLFTENFRTYEGGVSAEVRAAGPRV